jgi:hypothetical protein
MEGFSLAIGFCWAIFCAGRICWLIFGSKRDVQLNPLFESYVSIGIVLGFLTAVFNGAEILGLETNRNEFNFVQLLYVLGFLAWSPLSLVALTEAPRRFAYLPVYFMLSSILVCGLTASLISDLEPYPEWPKYVFFIQGLIHLSLSTIAIRRVDVFHRQA